jgi:16S rRNA (guanine966-N2)-methyltransferase
VRETLFNWLGQDLTGRKCLDLFAGSGALGMEAASRGAELVVMVEKNRSVFRVLQENVKKLDFRNIALHNEDGLNFAQRTVNKPGSHGDKFDVIFLDPPFSSDYLQKLLPMLGGLLQPEGRLYVESGARIDAGETWSMIKHGKAGAVNYQLLEYAQHD